MQGELAEDVVVTWHPVTGRGQVILDDGLNLGGEFRRGSLVGIYKQNPLCVRHRVEREVVRLGKVFVRELGNDPRAGLLRRYHRIIAAKIVTDDHLIGPAQAGDAVSNVMRFIFSDDNGRDA